MANSSPAHTERLATLTAYQRRIIDFCDTPRSLSAIMALIGVSGRGHFKWRHLDPLLAAGLLRMTQPDHPKHPDQAYVLTEAGVTLKARRTEEG